MSTKMIYFFSAAKDMGRCNFAVYTPVLQINV